MFLIYITLYILHNEVMLYRCKQSSDIRKPRAQIS